MTRAGSRALGAEVHNQNDLLPEVGPVLGKGDAMWRSLAVLTGDVIVFLDADSEHFGAHFACGLLGPLLCDNRISFVKGLYRRPFRVGETTLPDGGGRVTEPPPGRCSTSSIPIWRASRSRSPARWRPAASCWSPCRSSPATASTSPCWSTPTELVGLEGLAQVDLDVRQNAHQSLRDLGPMAFAVLRALASRLERDGRLAGPLPTGFFTPGEEEFPAHGVEPVERPPVAKQRAAA